MGRIKVQTAAKPPMQPAAPMKRTTRQMALLLRSDGTLAFSRRDDMSRRQIEQGLAKTQGDAKLKICLMLCLGDADDENNPHRGELSQKGRGRGRLGGPW